MVIGDLGGLVVPTQALGTQNGTQAHSSFKQQKAILPQHHDFIEGKWCPKADLNHRHADFQSRVVQPHSITCADNSVKLDAGNQYVTRDLSNFLEAFQPRVREAAMWLYLNRSQVSGNVLVFLRRKFILTTMEATDAAKAAHQLTYR
ncbi:hypothetical protein RMS29_001840 [Agrobacterium rosae]|uniref:Uncharacterized protein n=1 Tax=Agrobacterium rosae TaxID=1972867 RepID=A0ABU4VVY6_9HYPH|nr:hypothetical protein [Agrobacterium rosae]MDX8329660.1 hypothetical protein [Agrobacterium rosae]